MKRTLIITSVAAGAVALAACQSGNGMGQVKVAVQIAPLVGGSVDACGNGLTSAKLVLRHVELEGESVEEVEANPLLVDIATSDFNGAIQQDLVSAAIPVGTYGEASFQVHTLEAGDPEDAAAAAADPNLGAMMAAGDSVRIEGVTSGGTAIVFESALTAKQEKAVNVVVGNSISGIDGVTLTVDANGWFVDPVSGACLDPNDPASHGQIEANVKASIRVDEDDDHDGVGDDHDGDHGTGSDDGSGGSDDGSGSGGSDGSGSGS
jgi:hypothetical protein